METIITRFVAELRREGLRISPGESLDAVCALAHGGLEGRGPVHALLRLTLVKSINDNEAFDRVFERFFNASPERMGNDPDTLLEEVLNAMVGGDMLGTNPEMINENMTLAGVDAGLRPEDLRDLSGLKEIDLDQLDGSEFEIRLKGYQGAMSAPRPSLRMPQNPVTMAFKMPTPQKRELAFSAEDLEAMQDAVSRMMLRLKKDIRRVKNRENRGKIHVIRTIQKNYRNGMVPMVLELRRRRKQKPRLVVLCDISFSVSHASQFMLLLLHTLHNRLMDVRSFVFNEDLVEITVMLSTSPINTMLEAIDRGDIVDLDANSDYGKVLVAFKNKFLDNLRGRPVVIFLGDARNNYNKANDWVLDQLREKAGYMLWLTPEDRSLWKRGDCLIDTYGAYFDRVEVVKNIEELNLIVENLLRNIYLEDEHRSRHFADPVATEQDDDYRSYYTRGGQASTPGLDATGRSHW
jgi:uncharacterized protein with von Willebrand factor type A (vWA) domain